VEQIAQGNAQMLFNLAQMHPSSLTSDQGFDRFPEVFDKDFWDKMYLWSVVSLTAVVA